MHGLEQAELFFSIVFFVVVTSVIIQGTTIPMVARLLHVDTSIKERTRYPLELDPSIDTKAALKEVEIEPREYACGKLILELNLPDNVLVTLVNREGKFIVPSGATVIQEHDKLLILAAREDIPAIRKLLKNGIPMDR